MEEERKLLAMDLGVECLEHHGILGQKWGLRRYQNEDGSLTEAGKRRYAREVAKEQRVARSIEKGERRMRIKEAKANAKAAEAEAKARILEAKARSKQADAKDASDKANVASKDILQKPKMTDEQRKERNRKIGMALGIVGGAAAIGFGYKYAADALKKSGDIEIPKEAVTGTSKSGKKYTLNKNATLSNKKDSNKSSDSKQKGNDNKGGDGKKKGNDSHGSRDKNYAAAKDLEDWIKIAGTGLDFISKISNTYKTVSGGGGGK